MKIFFPQSNIRRECESEKRNFPSISFNYQFKVHSYESNHQNSTKSFFRFYFFSTISTTYVSRVFDDRQRVSEIERKENFFIPSRVQFAVNNFSSVGERKREKKVSSLNFIHHRAFTS
jgi:hypothetical protein